MHVLHCSALSSVFLHYPTLSNVVLYSIILPCQSCPACVALCSVVLHPALSSVVLQCSALLKIVLQSQFLSCGVLHCPMFPYGSHKRYGYVGAWFLSYTNLLADECLMPSNLARQSL